MRGRGSLKGISLTTSTKSILSPMPRFHYNCFEDPPGFVSRLLAHGLSARCFLVEAFSPRDKCVADF